jgi:hypothetical protein
VLQPPTCGEPILVAFYDMHGLQWDSFMAYSFFFYECRKRDVIARKCLYISSHFLPSKLLNGREGGGGASIKSWMLRIGEVPSSNLGPETGCPDRYIVGSLFYPDKYLKLATSFPIHHSHKHPNIHCYIINTVEKRPRHKNQ